MKNSTCFIIALVILLCGCSRENDNDSSDVCVDVEKCLQESISFYDKFSDLDVIMLDNNQDAIFDFQGVGKWAISDSSFFFIDATNELIRVFSSNGKWLFNVHNIGRSNDEYRMVYDIYSDNKTNMLYVLDPTGRILCYPYSNFIKSDHTVNIGNIIQAPDNFFVDSKGRILLFSEEDERCRIVIADYDSSSVARLDYDIEQYLFDFGTHSNCFFSYRDSVRFFESNSGTLFSIDTDSVIIKPILSWNFGKYSLRPEEIACKESNYRATIEHVNWRRNNGYRKVFPFVSMCETDNFIAANVDFRNQIHTIFYDKVNSNVSFFHKTSEGVGIAVGKIIRNNMYSIVRACDVSEYANSAVVGPDIINLINSNIGKAHHYILKYTVKDEI